MSNADPARSGPAPGGDPDPTARLVLVVLGVLALVALGALLLSQIDRTGDPGIPPATAPAAPDDLPSAGAGAAPPAQVGAITVEVDRARVGTLDNSRLFGGDPEPDSAAAETAVSEVREVLGAYLDAAFVAPATRLTAAPLADLLTTAAQATLTADDRAALGAVDTRAALVGSEPVEAQARVLTAEDGARLVVISYELRATAQIDGGGQVPMAQTATMVFVRDDGAWRADAVDAVLELETSAEDPR